MRPHHPHPAVPTDDDISCQLDRADKNTANSTGAAPQPFGEHFNHKVIARAHKLLSAQENHPNQTYLDPIIGLGEVIDRHKANKDIGQKHDDDRRQPHNAYEARDAAHPVIDGFKEIQHHTLPHPMRKPQ